MPRTPPPSPKPAGVVRPAGGQQPAAPEAEPATPATVDDFVRVAVGAEPADRPGDHRHRRGPGTVRPGRAVPEPRPGGELGRDRRPDRARPRHPHRPAGHPEDRHRAEADAVAGGRREGGRSGDARPARRAVRGGRGGAGRVLRGARPPAAGRRFWRNWCSCPTRPSPTARRCWRTSRSPGSTSSSWRSSGSGSGRKRAAVARELPAAYRRLAAAAGDSGLPVPAGGRLVRRAAGLRPGAGPGAWCWRPTRTCGRRGSGWSGRRRPSAGPRPSRSRTSPSTAGTSASSRTGRTTGRSAVSMPLPVWNRNQGNIRAAKAELGMAVQDVGRVENDLAEPGGDGVPDVRLGPRAGRAVPHARSCPGRRRRTNCR